jgi:quinoprotein glucose dehydrogenase
VTKPPPFERQGVSEDDLIDFTPELRAEAVALSKVYRFGPLFTPPALSTWPAPLATLMLPSDVGGANWPGGALDPSTSIFYVFSMTQVAPLGLVPPKPGSTDMRYVQGRAADPNPPAAADGAPRRSLEGQPGGPLFVRGLPLIKPPYGRITAIDLNRGEIVWQIAHGETADNVRNHAALKGLSIPRTGRTGRIGVLVTKSLVIAGDGGFFTTPSGVRGAMLRAYEKSTGTEVGSVYLPAPQTGSPSTYLLNGRQYIVLSVSGSGYSGEVIAFRLPSGR